MLAGLIKSKSFRSFFYKVIEIGEKPIAKRGMLVMSAGVFWHIILLRCCVVPHFSFIEEMGMNHTSAVIKNVCVHKQTIRDDDEKLSHY